MSNDDDRLRPIDGETYHALERMVKADNELLISTLTTGRIGFQMLALAWGLIAFRSALEAGQIFNGGSILALAIALGIGVGGEVFMRWTTRRGAPKRERNAVALMELVKRWNNLFPSDNAALGLGAWTIEELDECKLGIISHGPKCWFDSTLGVDGRRLRKRILTAVQGVKNGTDQEFGQLEQELQAFIHRFEVVSKTQIPQELNALKARISNPEKVAGRGRPEPDQRQDAAQRARAAKRRSQREP